jgi:hypothetical protein
MENESWFEQWWPFVLLVIVIFGCAFVHIYG